MVLDKVPGLSVRGKSEIRRFLKDKSMGINNNPRPFSSEDHAARGIVSCVCCYYQGMWLRFG